MPGILLTEKTCKTALNKTGIPGYRYCLNPYSGCAHGCVYCYASFMCRFTGRKNPWGKFLDVKVNFPQVLEKQLKGRNVPGGRVLLGTVTDAYQPGEAVYGLTRSCLEILAGHPFLEVDILTKSALVARDLPLLKKLSCCSVGFTVTTVDDKAARILEPGAPPPGLRLAAAVKLIEAGIPVWVFVAPVLPGVVDTGEAPAGLFRALKQAGVKEVLADFLNPYPAVVRRLKGVYRRYFPAALADLEMYLTHRDLYLYKSRNALAETAAGYGCELGFV